MMNRLSLKQNKTKQNKTDWQSITDSLNDKGYALVTKYLNEQHCIDLISQFDDAEKYRKTVSMERYRFGLGKYKYFDYPLPEIIQRSRENLYSKLVPIANLWMNRLNIDKQFPKTLDDMLTECHSSDQRKPTPLILKYQKGGFNTLHQDLYGKVYFPIQAAIVLSQPECDFTGGEFVLTQQIPRAQSKAIVLNPQKGDMILFTTNFRPVKGARSYYRSIMKHGVSELQSGERYTLGIIFHDAEN